MHKASSFSKQLKRVSPFLLVATVLTLSACNSKQETSMQSGQMPALPVHTITAQTQTVPILVEAVAQTEGAKETEVRAQVSGILQKRLYKEGDAVRENQVLFQIDPTPYRLAAEQARAQLAQQKASAERAEREKNRLAKLFEQQAISQREFDDSASSFKNADAAVIAATARLHEAELNLSYTEVRAPIAGISGRSIRSEGSLIQAGTDSLLTSITVADPIWARFALNPQEAAKILSNNNKVDLLLPDGSVYQQSGKLNFTASTISTKTGTVEMRAEFNNPKHLIFPGQFVKVRIYAGEQQAFRVPQIALMQSEQGKIVWVANNGKALPRPVETSGWIDHDWIIIQGLKTGDQVILDNLIKLRPGAAVQVQQSKS